MRPHIMIVDDAIDQIELMKTIFNMIDPSLEIISAMDGDEAIEFLKKNPQQLPRVILLDLRMPKKTGHEIIRELKSEPDLKNIPICAFSSSDNPKDIYEAYNDGANFYFRKPTGIDRLSKFAEHFRSLWFEFASLA